MLTMKPKRIQIEILASFSNQIKKKRSKLVVPIDGNHPKQEVRTACH